MGAKPWYPNGFQQQGVDAAIPSCYVKKAVGFLSDCTVWMHHPSDPAESPHRRLAKRSMPLRHAPQGVERSGRLRNTASALLFGSPSRPAQEVRNVPVQRRRF